MTSETSPLVVSDEGQNDVSTVFSILKLIMGAGGFAFPWAFAHMGIAAGLFAVFGVVGLGCFTLCDLKVLKTLAEKQHGNDQVTYADIARMSIGCSGSAFVYMMSVFASLLACAAYLAYVAETLSALWPTLDRSLTVLVTALVLLPITWLDDFSWLAQLAVCGTCAVVLGYFATIAYAMLTLYPQSRPPLFMPLHSTAKGFGPVAFLLCIQFAIFPIMNASSASRRAGGFEFLVMIGMLIAAVINGAFGALGLVFFGLDVSTIVLNDIASGSWFFVATKLLMCMDLVCTYPLVFLVARQVLEPSIIVGFGGHDGMDESHLAHRDSSFRLLPSISMNQCVLRTCLVCFTVANALIGEFGGLVSLVGDIALTTMAFVLPPIMSLATLWPEMSVPRRCTNIVVLLIGIIVSVSSTWETLASMTRHH